MREITAVASPCQSGDIMFTPDTVPAVMLSLAKLRSPYSEENKWVLAPVSSEALALCCGMLDLGSSV